MTTIAQRLAAIHQSAVADTRSPATAGAMPDGAYPIPTVAALKRAIRAIGRAKDPAAVKRHIIARARALGAGELIPPGWTVVQDGVLPDTDGPTTIRTGIKSPEPRSGRRRQAMTQQAPAVLSILQVDAYQRLVYAVVQTPDSATTPGTMPEVELYYPAAVIQQMAHDFMIEQRQNAIGLQHSEAVTGEVVPPEGEYAVMVESYIAPHDLVIRGRTVAQGSWVTAYKITDDAVFDQILQGRIAAVSLATNDYDLEDME